MIVVAHFSTPPPPSTVPLHWSTKVMGSVEIVVFVVHVPPPAPTGPAAPTQTLTVTVDGETLSIVPSPWR